MSDLMRMTAQSLRLAASDMDAADRALRLALAECKALRQQVEALNAEREAYFKPTIVGGVTLNVHHDQRFCAVRFRAQIGSATLTGSVDDDVFLEQRWDDPAVMVARQAAQNLAGLIGEKIGPALVQAMKERQP